MGCRSAYSSRRRGAATSCCSTRPRRSSARRIAVTWTPSRRSPSPSADDSPPCATSRNADRGSIQSCAMPAIETRDLQRVFSGGITAVAGVDLQIPEREIYAFLGPNGAGKTTTVRMLTTLLRPSGGSARVAGHDVVDEASDVRRAIGVALQEAALDPLMTGRELMRLSCTLHGIRGKEGRERADALIERVGLTGAADRRIGTYSGGMRRRLDLGSALVHEPRVLFLEEADQLADRVGIIANGLMAAEGTPAALKAEVGVPRLEVAIARGDIERAE